MGKLADLAPTSPGYANLSVADAFDWAASTDDLPIGDFYLVAFRSVRRAGVDEATLTAYDERAHLEAESAPGFLHYLKGPLAADRTCLSFCLWTDRAHARAAAARSAHREAVALTAAMYERYELAYVRVWREVRGGVLQFAPYAATGG
ncbi:MAG: hypothetical protein ACJ77B_06485, partial [Chloroflexota bacterium]